MTVESTWRFLFAARLAAIPLWRAIPLAGDLPFLKGFSLWTNQSERVYFYWPPGPNPVVTISTRVGPGSRLTLGLRPWVLCSVSIRHRNFELGYYCIHNAPLAIRYPPDIRPRPLPGLILSIIICHMSLTMALTNQIDGWTLWDSAISHVLLNFGPELASPALNQLIRAMWDCKSPP